MRRGIEFYLGLATLIALVTATALAYYQPLLPEPNLTENPFTLAAQSEDNRLRVDWDANHPALRHAKHGTLTVIEAGTEKQYTVEESVLRKGGLDYLQTAPEALLSLTIHRSNRADITAYVRRVSAPEPPKPVVAEAKPETRRAPARTRRARRR
jgi:hypothetical protein